MEGEREGVEDGGDKGCGAAECFGDYEVVVEEDVVAVISDDEATVLNRFGICDHDDGVLWVMESVGFNLIFNLMIMTMMRIHARRRREVNECFCILCM